MQLAGDPQPLLGHPAACLSLPLLISEAQPVRSLGGQGTPAADGVTEHDREGQHHDGRQEVVDQRGQRLACAEPDQEQADGHVGGRDDDGERQESGHSRVIQRQAEQRGGGDIAPVNPVIAKQQQRAGDQHAARPPPAQQDRQRDHGAEYIGGRVKRLLARPGRDGHVQFHRRGNHDRCRHVDQPDTERAAESAHAVTVRDLMAAREWQDR